MVFKLGLEMLNFGGGCNTEETKASTAMKTEFVVAKNSRMLGSLFSEIEISTCVRDP